MNGDGRRNALDRHDIDDFIEANDGADGVWDEAVVIRVFALDFSVFDVNYDGTVDARDLDAANTTNNVDLDDAALFQRCLFSDILVNSACAAMDFDGNTQVTLDDWPEFVREFSGPDDRRLGLGILP